ncbi:MAG: acyl-CoA dehydratase activase-related protein [Thermodesulfobacteriota bacterium]|nr:acyl-CoA dehydratase activase-related protein [Thermodesulfobacteriota bacterium]
MEEKGRIGIPKALMFYRYFPLWKTFFEALGWKVVVSGGVGKRGKIIYFEDSCLPMKLLVTHSVDLKDKVDHLFVPRLVSLHRTTIMCPKFRGAPDIVRLATEGNVSIIDETIDLRVRGYSFLQSFSRIGEKLGASKKESKKAFHKAEQSFSNFQKGWEDRINRLPAGQLFELEIPTPSAPMISSIPGDCVSKSKLRQNVMLDLFQHLIRTINDETLKRVQGDKKRVTTKSLAGADEEEKGDFKVAFIGHPYNLFDTDVNKNILSFAKGLGMRIITSDALSEKEVSQQISGLSKEIYWSSGREIVGSLFHFLSGGVDGVVFLTSFKCGIDALLQEFVKRRLKVRGGTPIPLLVLSLDEHTGREGLTTRLEAFRDVMEERKISSE